MKPTQVTEPQDPDTMARSAGRDLYGSRVGVLRRIELWRLGNHWGMNFPVGASKDYMLPFFMRLEAEGKDPLRPPGVTIASTGDLRTREVTYSDQSHIERAPADFIAPEAKSEFEAKLEKLHHSQLKKICKLRGVPQERSDRKQDLVAKIVAASGGTDFEQDITGRGE